MFSLFLYHKGKYIKNDTDTQIELQRLMTDDRLNNSEISFEKLLDNQYPLKDVTYEMKYSDEVGDRKIDISYDKLPREIRRIVDYTTISVIEIKVDSQDQKNRILYKVFENLHSGGSELKNQELRNGVYQCKLYDMLHDINDNNLKWRRIYGEKHKHSRDVELLLRFAALQHYSNLNNGEIQLEKYKNSYPKFLNDFSDVALNFEKNEISKFRGDIERFIDSIESGERIANLLLESVYLASTYVEGDYWIKNNFCKNIECNGDYEKYVSSDSSGNKKVEGRLNYVYRRLSEYVNGNKR